MQQTAPKKVVLVTGAARRIGRAIATDLAAHGWHVGVHYGTSATQASALVADIRAAGGQAVALDADLADAAAVGDLIDRLAAEFGPVNCLINNASLFEHDAIDTMTRDSWAAHMDVNLYAPALLMQAFAAQLPEPMRGNVINIIDQRVWRLTPRFFSYTLSKAGLWTMTQTAAQALAPRIRVNAIAPGPTLRNARQSAEDFATQEENVLLQHGAALEEFGAAVRFILAAQSMTGQMIALDGGQHLAWETPDVHGLDE